MAETFGITPLPIRAAVLPQNNRSIFDINALFKAHALKQEDARLKLTENKYAADAMLETHKLFDDFKYLPKDSQTVDEVFAPVQTLMDKGISNLEEAMNARNQTIKAFNDPRIRKVVIDRQKWEGLVKAGSDFKDQLGNNTIKFTQYLTDLASTPGSDLQSASINPFFDTEKAKREKLKEEAQTAGLEAQTKYHTASAKTIELQNKATTDYTTHVDDFIKKYPNISESIKTILQDPKTREKADVREIFLASEMAAKDNSPGLTYDQKFVNYYDELNKAGKYAPVDPGGSTGISISYGNSILDNAYGNESNNPVVIPGKTDSAGKQDKAEYVSKKNPRTGVWTPHPKIIEAKAGVSPTTFYTVVGKGANKQVLSINPNVDNNPTNEPRDMTKTTDYGTFRGDSDVFDTSSKPWSEGGWTNAVSVQGTGKTLLESDFAGLDPWDDNITVTRDNVTKDLVIKYPGKSKTPIYFRMVNDKNVDDRGENTFGDIETNNIQIVQAHIKKLQETKQMSDEEISKQIIYSVDEGGNPKFTMKNMIFNPRRMAGITQSDIAPIMELDAIGRGEKSMATPKTVNQVPQVLKDNYNANIADTETSKYFTDNQKFLNKHGDSLYGVFQLHPSVLKTLKTATEDMPGLLRVITDYTDDPTKHDLTRQGKSSDHHAGLAIDLSVKDNTTVLESLELINRLQKTGSVRTVLLEYGSDAERRVLVRDIENKTGLIEDKEVGGVTLKLMPRGSAGATGSNIHISFKATVPQTKSQAMFDEAAVGKDSLITAPGFETK